MNKILTVYDLIRELTKVSPDTKLSIQLPCPDSEVDNEIMILVMIYIILLIVC